MIRVNEVIIIIFDDNNNDRYRENNFLNYNEVLVKKVVKVESENEVIRYKVALMGRISTKS